MNINPTNYAHISLCWVLFWSCIWYWSNLSISFRVTSHDCPSASEVTLKDIGKTGHYHITTKCKQSMNHAHNFWDVSHRVHLNILLVVINETKTMKYRHNYCIQSTHNIRLFHTHICTMPTSGSMSVSLASSWTASETIISFSENFGIPTAHMGSHHALKVTQRSLGS